MRHAADRGADQNIGPDLALPAGALGRSDRQRRRVLVIDDHRQARESMADVLRHAGHQVERLASAIEALKILERESFDVIVTDLQMPGMTGLEFIRHLHERPHGAQVLMVTAHASVASAVDAMRHGAFDYIEKPFNVDQLEQLVARAIQHGRLLDRKGNIEPAASSGPPVMIGTSSSMQILRTRIAQVARTAETVLIAGESGTGKELVARAIHAASSRSAAPLVSLNCPVLSAHLMESELFGHERGAFTGAESPRTGRFELADGGTILLDEITRDRVAAASEAAAGVAGADVRARRFQHDAKRRCARAGHDEPPSARRSGRRTISRGFVLSPGGAADDDSAAARAPRRRAGIGRLFSSPGRGAIATLAVRNGAGRDASCSSNITGRAMSANWKTSSRGPACSIWACRSRPTNCAIG